MDTTYSQRLEKVLRTHKVFFCFVCLLVGSVYRECIPTGQENFVFELELCIFLVGIFGIAHGALDYITAASTLPFRAESPKRSTQQRIGFCCAFSGIYLLVALLYFELWAAAAPLALAFFLVLSIVHFACLEKQFLQPIKFFRSISKEDSLALAIAGMPILLPCGLKPDSVAPIITTLIGDSWQAGVILQSLTAISYCWFALSLFLIYKIVTDQTGINSQELKEKAFMLACLAFLALKVSPIIAFALYFCGSHSVEESIRLSHFLSPENLKKGFLRFTLLAAVPTTVVVAAAAYLFSMDMQGGAHLVGACSRMLFIIISCITVPHFAIKCSFQNAALINLCVRGNLS